METVRPDEFGRDAIHPDLQHLGHDQGLVEKIMRKRQAELERRAQLRDPRTRTMGVAHDVLDAQVAERRLAQEAEAGMDVQTHYTLQIQEQVAQAAENTKVAAGRARKKGVVEYSLQNLRKDQRREYALSDPNSLRNEKPPIALGSEEYFELGPSSMQKFEGEDLSMGEKSRMLKQAQHEWLSEQIAEKKAREQAQKDADNAADRDLLMANEVRALCERASLDEAREDKLEEAGDNIAMAAMVRARKQAAQRREADERAVHLATNTQFLSGKEAGDSALDSKKDYRGLSYAEELEVYATNDTMVQQNYDKVQEEKELETAWSGSATKAMHVQGALEGYKNRLIADKRQQMVRDNQALAQAKREKDFDERRKYRSFEHDS